MNRIGDRGLRNLLLLVAGLSAPSVGAAQAAASPQSASPDLVSARAAVTRKAADEAVRHARAAWGTLQTSMPPEARAEVASTAGEAFRLAGRADSAAHYFGIAAGSFKQALLPVRAGHVLAAMSEDALEVGRLDQAMALMGEVVQLAGQHSSDRTERKALLLVRMFNDLGLLLYAEGKADKAREAFQRAKNAVNPTQSEYIETERGLALLSAVGPKPNTVSSPFTLSHFLSGRQLMPSIVLLEPARPPVRALSDGWLTQALGVQALRAGAVVESYVALKDALVLLTAAAHQPSIRRTQGALGALYARIGRPDSAAHYRRLAGADTLANIPAGTGSLESSSVALRQAIRRRPTSTLHDVGALLVRARAANDRLSEARTLGAMGYYHLYRASPRKPAVATAYYDSAFAAMHQMSNSGARVWSDRRKGYVPLPDWVWVELTEQSALLQGEAVLAWLARKAELGERAALFGAVAAADRGRSQALVTLARGSRALNVGLSGEIWNNAFLDRGTMPVNGQSMLSAPMGEYRAVGEGRTTLSYVMAGDTLVAWLHTAGDASEAGDSLAMTRRFISPDELAELIARARRSIGVDSAATRQAPALEHDAPSRGARSARAAAADDGSLRRLAEVLLPREFAPQLRRRGILVVVASGPIAAVPFAALPIEATGEPLGAYFAVQYVPSLSWSHLSRGGAYRRLPTRGDSSARLRRTAWLSRAVVVGNPFMPSVVHSDGRRGPLSALPGAEREAQAVAALMGVAPLLGPSAMLAAVRERAKDATILHFATHGFAYSSEERVGDSFVALTPSATDDGLLTVSEVLAEELLLPSAELVVLSACQTGLGRLTQSEGTLGLQRAFLASGAENLLVSLWSVSDEATALLLESFYRHWLNDEDQPRKAEALRRAQQDVRAKPRFAHPRYWAAFQLVGVGRR